MKIKILFTAFLGIALALPCVAQLTSEQVEALRRQKQEELNKKADSIVAVLNSLKRVQERQAQNAVLEKVTDDNFYEWVAANKVFVVLLGARTCPSCVAVEPLVTDMSIKYKGKAKIVKYDCKVSMQKMYEYNLSFYPAVLIFKNGKLLKLLPSKTEIVLQLENEIIKALQ